MPLVPIKTCRQQFFIVIQSEPYIIETECLATVYVQTQVQVQVRQCNLFT